MVQERCQAGFLQSNLQPDDFIALIVEKSLVSLPFMARVAIAVLRYAVGKRFLLSIARGEKSLQCLNKVQVPGLLMTRQFY